MVIINVVQVDTKLRVADATISALDMVKNASASTIEAEKKVQRQILLEEKLSFNRLNRETQLLRDQIVMRGSKHVPSHIHKSKSIKKCTNVISSMWEYYIFALLVEHPDLAKNDFPLC